MRHHFRSLGVDCGSGRARIGRCWSTPIVWARSSSMPIAKSIAHEICGTPSSTKTPYCLSTNGRATNADVSAAGRRSLQALCDSHGSRVGGCAKVHTALAVTYLNLARAAMQGDTAQAKKMYEEFFKLWQNADSYLPIVIEAKRE